MPYNIAKHLLAALFIFFATTTQAQQKNDYLLSFTDSSSGKALIGYKTTSGKTIIQPKYSYSYTDTFYTMAIVLHNNEWIGINRNEKTILKPFIFDNGPDYVSEGLFRFVENSKIGFANMQGKKVIAAQFDFATPFSDGFANYTLGGDKEYEDAEHWSWTGGYENGFVNKQGQRFKKVGELKNNKRQAWMMNNKQVLLNHNGEISSQIPDSIKTAFAGEWEINTKHYSSSLIIKFEPGKDYATFIDIGTGEAPEPLTFHAQIKGNLLVVPPRQHTNDYMEMEIKNGKLYLHQQPTVWDADDNPLPPNRDRFLTTIFTKVKPAVKKKTKKTIVKKKTAQSKSVN